MPDTWTILKEYSLIAFGDAWEHLNNQQNGEIFYTLTDGLEVEMSKGDVDVEIIPTSVEVEVNFNEIEVT